MGRYKPELNNRILLAAHWDTRPFADRGNERRMDPIDGANDGGSGVGVILEIARIIHEADTLGPEIGIDVVFFDSSSVRGQKEAVRLGTLWKTRLWGSPLTNCKLICIIMHHVL